jgi:hypothetical protein
MKTNIKYIRLSIPETKTWSRSRGGVSPLSHDQNILIKLGMAADTTTAKLEKKRAAIPSSRQSNRWRSSVTESASGSGM